MERLPSNHPPGPKSGAHFRGGPIIVDGVSDLNDAAVKIAATKALANVVPAPLGDAVVIVGDIYYDALMALTRAGGYLCGSADAARVHSWLCGPNGFNEELAASGTAVVAVLSQSLNDARRARFFMIEGAHVGPQSLHTDRNPATFVPIYRAKDLTDTAAIVHGIQGPQGRWRCCSIFTRDLRRAKWLAQALNTDHVQVNWAPSLSTGGRTNDKWAIDLDSAGALTSRSAQG